MIFLRRKVYKRDFEEEAEVSKFTYDHSYRVFLNGKKALNVRRPTIVSYEEHYRFFRNWLTYKGYELEYTDELTTEIVYEYINYMKEDHYNIKTKVAGLSTQTINARIRFLKTFYSFLEKEQLIAENVMLAIKYLRVDAYKAELLTDEEMKRLLNVPDVKLYPQWRDKVFMHVLYDTCLRMHEAITLEESDINFATHKINLPSNKAKDRRHRVIPLSNITVKMLSKLITENKAAFGDVSYVFLNWYGERLSEDTFRRSIKRYVAKAGITKNFTCHDFRRQGITELLKNGASLFAVQAIAGHSQISTTKKYVFFDEQTLQKQHSMYSPLQNQVYKVRRH